MQTRTRGMTMRQPATRWQDGLPVGNGTAGAMMYGRICDEQILLNHEAVWHRTAKPRMVDLADLLPELREMIDAGRYRDAQEFFHTQNEARGGEWCRTDPYQPTCDIRLRAATSGPFVGYRRGVDFSSGVAWMQWQDDAGAFRREVFVSRADDVVVLRLTADNPGRVSCRLRLEAHDEGRNRAEGGFGAPPDPPPATFEHSAADGWLTFTGTFDTGDQYGAVGRVIATGGAVETVGDDLVVHNANEALLLVKLFAEESAGPAGQRLRAELDPLNLDFDTLLSRHIDIHRKVFERMTLHLTDGEETSNEELLLQAYDGNVPTALIQTMFDYGRHLLICSGRTPGWPAHLQGVWNGDYTPAWSSDYHNDENIQMNYWQALPGNLPEIALPVFDYYERFMDDYRENARKIYGCRGILAPIAQSTHGLMYPGLWANWTAAAGWLGQLFYDYYLFTEDRDFLARRAVPWLKETALFYEDFLFEGPDGKLVFSPSHSPENMPARDDASRVTINATMDVAICREVLENLCEACRVLDIDADGIARWEGMLAKLPDYEVNADGAMREWLHPAFPDNYHHRHQSHIYPVFPGISVTEETDPRIYDACRVAVEKRLVIGLTSQSGWSMAHMANIYARLGWGNRALECMEILTRSSTGPNLFTYHNDWRSMGLSLGGWGRVPPFQIDANFGLAAAVLEMLVFSRPGLVKLLPALPDKWPSGRALGLACRGGITIDLDWNLREGRLNAVLTSSKARTLTVKFPKAPKTVTCVGATLPSAETGEAYRVLNLPAGDRVELNAVFERT